MLKKSLVSLLVIIFYIGSCFIIYNTEKVDIKSKNIKTTNNISKLNSTNTKKVSNEYNDKPIATLQISKINLNQKIYDIKSKKNNVEKNVTILNDDKNLIVLAAHSGPGTIAYFNDLDKLKINDKIKLIYNNNNISTYKIIKIEEQIKDGTIEINKTNHARLILTTCSKKDSQKQLVLITEKIDA